jgi:hypothetical protein
MSVLDAYFVPGGFIRVAAMPVNGSASDTVEQCLRPVDLPGRA